MYGQVILEWNYKPTNYFESEYEDGRERYSLKIGDGKAIAIIDLDYFDTNPTIRQELHDEILNRLRSVQLLNYQKFELADSSMAKIHHNGRKEYFLEAKSGIFLAEIFSGDIQHRDKDGNIILDTKRDRVEKQTKITDLILEHRGDETLEALLRFLHTAVRDPDNELVHHYDIRDALDKRFGSAGRFRSKLGVTRSEYNRLGELCNDLPLRQGRHRGRAMGKLRDATAAELTEARNITRAMIESYLHYLEQPHG